MPYIAESSRKIKPIFPAFKSNCNHCESEYIIFFAEGLNTFLKCGSNVGSKKLHVIDTTTIIAQTIKTCGILIIVLNEPSVFCDG